MPAKNKKKDKGSKKDKLNDIGDSNEPQDTTDVTTPTTTTAVEPHSTLLLPAAHTNTRQDVYLFLFPLPKENIYPTITMEGGIFVTDSFKRMQTPGCYTVSTTITGPCSIKWSVKSTEQKREKIEKPGLNVFCHSTATSGLWDKAKRKFGYSVDSDNQARFIEFFKEVAKARVGDTIGVKALLEVCVVSSVMKKAFIDFSLPDAEWEKCTMDVCSTFYRERSPLLLTGIIHSVVFHKEPSVLHRVEMNKGAFLHFLREIAPVMEEPQIVAIFAFLERELPPRYREVFRYLVMKDYNIEKDVMKVVKTMDCKTEDFPKELQDQAKKLFYSSLITVKQFRDNNLNDDEIWEILRKRFQETGYQYPTDERNMQELKDFLVTTAKKKNTFEVLELALNSPFFTRSTVDRHHEILLDLAAHQRHLPHHLADRLKSVIRDSYKNYKVQSEESVFSLLQYFYYCATTWGGVFDQCTGLLRDVTEALPGAGIGGTTVEMNALLYRARAILYNDKKLIDKKNKDKERSGEDIFPSALLLVEKERVIKLIMGFEGSLKDQFMEKVYIKGREMVHPDILFKIFIDPDVKELEKSLRDYDCARDNKSNLELAATIFPRDREMCNFLVNEHALGHMESAMDTLHQKMPELERIDYPQKRIIEGKNRKIRQCFDTLLEQSTARKLTVKQFRCIENNRFIQKGLKRLAKYCEKDEEFRQMEENRNKLLKKLSDLREVFDVAAKVAKQLQDMGVLSQVEDQIRRILATEREEQDSLSQDAVERLHQSNTTRRFSLEVDGICPGHSSVILQYFELKCVDAAETDVVPPASARLTDLIDIFTAFYKEHVVVPLQNFWKRLSSRAITAAELSDVLNIEAFEKDVKEIAEKATEEEHESYERRVDLLREKIVTDLSDQMRHFSKAFKITHQEEICNALRSFLHFCTNYKNFSAFGELATLVNVEVDFSPILMKRYSDCEESLLEIVKLIDHMRGTFPLFFRTPSCYTRRLCLCMKNGFPETVSKFLDDADFKKKKFESTSIVATINDKVAEEEGETVQMLLDFKKVMQTMFTASREVLQGLSQMRVKDAKKLQEFLCNSATCDTVLSRIETHFVEIGAMHGRQEVESSKAEAKRVIDKGNFIVNEENGTITFFAQVKVDGGLSKYSEDRLEEWTAQFICSQSQSEALDGDSQRSSGQIFYTFPVVVGHLRKIRDAVEELRSIGHPSVNDLPINLPGSISSKKLEKFIHKLQHKLQEWRSIVDSARTDHPLLYLCPRPLLQRLYMAMGNLRTTPLSANDLVALHEATLQPEDKKFPNDPNADARECLRKHGDDKMGAIEELVSKNFNREAFSGKKITSQQSLAYCVESHELELPSDEILLYVVSLFWHRYSRLPLPVEMLVCSPQTTTLEIEDFIGCWFNWVGHAHNWCPHDDSPFFCIVNADLLSRPVQDALVQRVVRYGSKKDVGENRPFLAIFAIKQSSISLQLRQSDSVEKKKQPDDYKTYIQEVQKTLQDEFNDTVFVISSKQPSCGKTRHIKELANRKKIRMATVAVQKGTTTETVLTKLREVYSERYNVGEKLLIHFDISAFADVTFLNEILFYLFVLRRLVSRRGDTLHPVLTDLLILELPNDGNFGENAKEVVPMLTLLSSKEIPGTEFDVKKIVMKADGVVVPVPQGIKTLKEVATHFNCTEESLLETNPGITTTTQLTPSTLLVPPRFVQPMTLTELSNRLNVSADLIMKVNTYIPNKEFVVRSGACNGRLAFPHITECKYLSFGSKCLVHFHKQQAANKRVLSHGAAIESFPVPSSAEISKAIDTLFPKAKTKLSRYVAYAAVCAQLTFAFGNHESLYYNEIGYHYNKLEYYITKLIVETVQNMCASAIPPRNAKNETEASRFARTPSFSEWRSHPFALFSDSDNFTLLTLGSDTSVLIEITNEDPDAGFKEFIKRSNDNLSSLNRIALEKLCLQLEGPQLNHEALKSILPLICMNDRVSKVVLALSFLPNKPRTMPLNEVDNDAIKWLIDFLSVENKRLLLNIAPEKLTVGDAITIIDKWLTTMFIHPGGSTNKPPYLLTPDLLVRKVALKMRMVAGIPAVVSGDQGCGKTLMCEAFARCSGCPYYVLYCNGSVTPAKLRTEMAKAIERAQRSPDTSVIVQLDEGNCLFDNWTLHQVMCDRVVDGLFIPPNMQFVVMLNPTKRRTEEQQKRFDQINTMGGMDYVSFNKDTETKSSARSDTTELVYDVSPTPESVLGLGFDFGSAATTFSSTRTYNGEHRMAKYISLSFDRSSPPDQVSDEMRFASSEVQFMIDHFFEPCCWEPLLRAFNNNGDKGGKQKLLPTYRNILVTCLRAMQYSLRETFKGEESVVSLRDIRKVCKLVPFVMRCFLVQKQLEDNEDLTDENVFDFLTKATVCALLMTYYLRLDEGARPEILVRIHSAWKAARNASKDLPPNFCELPVTPQELYGYFDSIAEYATSSLTKESDDLAMVAALKENAFLIIVCAKLKMDLFIVGCAGSSKSRALSSVLAASESRCPFFEAIGFELSSLVLQCTHHTTPNDVNRLAQNAAKVQFQDPNKCVVLVLEEVGATSKSKHNPLMTLHNIIDHGVDIGEEKNQPICVIGISNWWLAGAKMGRCNVVHRGLPNVEDLKEIGKMILGGTEAHWLKDFCDTVRTAVLNNQNPAEAKVLSRFFGMRDYYNCIKLLKLLLGTMSTYGGRKAANIDINNIHRHPHVVRLAIMISYGGLPPTTENMKIEYDLYRRLMSSFGSDLNDKVLATYNWTDNPDNPSGRSIHHCAACAEMAFQRKWLIRLNNLPTNKTTREKEDEREQLFKRHAKMQDNPRCEGFYEDGTEVPPSALHAVDIAAFTILHSETRHLMVFGDPCAVVGLLRLHGLLPTKGPYAAGVLFAAGATEKRLPEQLRIVKEIMARGGHLVIQGLGLSALLLEPANMHYIKRGDGENNFRTRLPMADGSSKLVPCHPDFRITMIVSEEEAARAPPPVVQRFTKVTLSYLASLNGVQRETLRQIKEEARIEWGDKTASLLNLLIPGFSDESLAMLIMGVSIRRTALRNNEDEEETDNEEGNEEETEEEEDEEENSYAAERDEIMVRLALSFSPDAWARVINSPESENNKDVISLWRAYYEDKRASCSRNKSLKEELDEVTVEFDYASHILLLTRQPDPSVEYIQQSVKEILEGGEEKCNDIQFTSIVYGNEPNSVSKFTSELERLRDLLIKASSNDADSDSIPTGLITVVIDLTSVSSAEDLWATFRSSTEQIAINSDKWMLRVIVVATVGDPLLAARTQKELPRLHYTNDWIVLHVDEVSPTVMTDMSLREIEMKPLSELCDAAFSAVSEDPESLLVLAQQLSQYAGAKLKSTNGVNEWIRALSDFLKTDLGKAYVDRVKKCVKESAENNNFDWKRPALQQQRETLRSTYVRYLMHVVQLALLPGLFYICGSIKTVTKNDMATQFTGWYKIVEENVELFFEVPESFIRCFDYCLQPDELRPELTGELFENRLPFSTPVIQVLRNVIRSCSDATNIETLLNDVRAQLPFYDQLTKTQREYLYYDAVTSVGPLGETTFTTSCATHNSRELLSFFNIASMLDNTIEWTRPPKGNEVLTALVLVDRFSASFIHVVIISHSILNKLDFMEKRISVSVSDIITEGKSHSLLSLDSVIAIKALSGGFQNETNQNISWDWLESLAIAEKSVPKPKTSLLPELDRLHARGLVEETLPVGLKERIEAAELKPVRLMLCKELMRDLNKPKQCEGWLVLGLTSEKIENSLRYLLIRPWLREMLFEGRSTSDQIKRVKETESLTSFMTQATYRELERCDPPVIVKALEIQPPKFPVAVRTAMCLGVILAALNNIAKNVGATDAALVNAVNRVLVPFRQVNREWLMLYTLRQGTSGGAELGDLLPFAQYLKEMDAFKDSKYLAILIEKLVNDQKARELPKLLDSQLLSNVVSGVRMLFETAQPNSIAGWYQARIKEGNLQDILLPGITTSQEYDVLIGDTYYTYIYSCPNGHKYGTDACHHINSESTCLQCKARIGGPSYDQLYPGNRQLGKRKAFVGNVQAFKPTTGFVISPWNNITSATSVRGLDRLQVLVLSTLSLCAVTGHDPANVNKGMLENDLLALLRDIDCEEFKNAENPTNAKAEFLFELFTDGATFFTTANGVSSRDTIEALCKAKLKGVQGCRALAAAAKAGTIDVVALIRDGPEAQAEMKKTMEEHHEILHHTPLQLLGYRFLPTPERLFANALLQDNTDRLKTLVFAGNSITVENADDVLQFLSFVREFDDICERTPELKRNSVNADELCPLVRRTNPVFQRMARLVEKLGCAQLNVYDGLLQAIDAGEFEQCGAEYFLVGQRDQVFIEGLYGGSGEDRSSFVVAQNTLIKTLLPERFSSAGGDDNDNDNDDNNERLLKPQEKPVRIRGTIDLLRLNLKQEMMRLLEEYHTDLIQLCPKLDKEAVDCYITHLTAHLKLHTLPILPDTCDENVVHNVDKIRNFSTLITPIPPAEEAVAYLRWLREAEPEQMRALSSFIRHLVQLAAADRDKHNKPLNEMVTQMELLTRLQRVGGQLFKTTPALAGCTVEQLLFLSALTWQGSLDTEKFFAPLEDAEEVAKFLKELDKEHLWEFFRAVAIFGQFSTSRTDLDTTWELIWSLDMNIDEAFDELEEEGITIAEIGSLWELLSAEFWSRDFTASDDKEYQFTAPSIGDLFRATCVPEGGAAATAAGSGSGAEKTNLPALRIPLVASRAASADEGSLTAREARSVKHVDAVPHENDNDSEADDDNVDRLWPALESD